MPAVGQVLNYGGRGMSSEINSEKILSRRTVATAQVHATGLLCHHNCGGGTRCDRPLMARTPNWEGELICSSGHRFDGELVKGLRECGLWRR